MKDANLIQTKAIPAAGASNNATAFDFDHAITEEFDIITIQVDIPALPALADTKTLTLTLQDSADNSSFTAVDPAISTTVTGAGGVGSAAKQLRLRLPKGVRRYVRFSQAVASAGGDSTALSVTYSVAFNE